MSDATKSVKRFLPKSEFGRNVVTLMTGTTIAQAIPIAISPILTRLYTPEDFGILALFVAVTAILGSIANGRYELAIMLTEKDEDAINVAALGLLIALCFSIVLLIPAIFLNAQITNLLGNQEIGLWLYFVPFVVLMTGLFNILNYLNTRKKLYKDIAKASVYKSVGMTTVQLGLGFLKLGVTGLITGQIVSVLISNLKLSLNVKKKYIVKAKLKRMLYLGARFKQFPIYSVPSSFVNTSSLQVPIFILSYLFSQAVTGLFSIAIKVLSLPVALIGSSIGQVFFQKASETRNQSMPLNQYTLQVLNKLTLIGLLPFSFSVVFSDYFFRIVFGLDWSEAGFYAQYLSVWLFFLFIHSPLTSLFEVYEKQKVALIFNVFLLASRILAMTVVGLLFLTPVAVVAAYTVVGVFFNIAILIYLLKLVGVAGVYKKLFIIVFQFGTVITVLFIVRSFL